MQIEWSGKATLVKYLREKINGDNGFFVRGMIRVYRLGLVERIGKQILDQPNEERRTEIKMAIKSQNQQTRHGTKN